MSVQSALKEGPFTLRDIASEAGLSYHAIQSYALGRRTPDPETAAKLAGILAARGAAITQLADGLRRIAVGEGEG